MVAFLHTLTDTLITTDPRWSNPFCLNTCTPVISGSNNACISEPLTYTVAPGETGTTYLWNITGSYTIISGGGAYDNTCTLIWTGGTSGSISVTQMLP